MVQRVGGTTRPKRGDKKREQEIAVWVSRQGASDVLEMEDGNTKDSTVDLRNLEAKVGMKMPESLLRWMQADVQDDNLPVPENLPSELFYKIQTLKSEMRELRSADVKILQQLDALNEGMECMRWLWDEHSSQTSLTPSHSSQNTPVIPNNQTLPDLDGDNSQLGFNGYETVTEQCTVQRSSRQSAMKREIHKVPVLEKEPMNECQRKLLGPEEGLDIQSSEAPMLVALQHKANDPDPCLLSGGQLLGYDIRWRWVEHEDDVMFL